MNKKILVVDDDPGLIDLLREALSRANYRVVFAQDGQEALRIFFTERPDLVILDIVLTSVVGWAVLDHIRELMDTPVIMLTALGQERDVVKGLREGADDYLAKPFSVQELLARCEAVLRRSHSERTEREDVYEDVVLRLDFRRSEVYVSGRKVGLSPLETRLLAALVRDANTVLDHQTLIDRSWGQGYGSRESLRVYIGYLRSKLRDDSPRPKLIETIRGFGYRYRRATLRDFPTWVHQQSSQTLVPVRTICAADD